MEWLYSASDWILDTTTSWFKPYLKEIAFSFVATLLVIYGDRITAFIRRSTSKYHYVVRVLIFVLVSGFGYGFATTYLTDLLRSILRWKTGSFLGITVIAVFLILGSLADRKNQV